MFTNWNVSLLVLAFRTPPRTGKARQTWKPSRGFTAFHSPTPNYWKSGRSSRRKPRTEIIGKLGGYVRNRGVSCLSFPPVHLSWACSVRSFVLKRGLDFRFPGLGANHVHIILPKHSESISSTVVENGAGDPQLRVSSVWAPRQSWQNGLWKPSLRLLVTL